MRDTLGRLISGIGKGQVGFPGMNRVITWTDAKVRGRVDSICQGQQVGFLLFCEKAAEGRAMGIVVVPTRRKPPLLIVYGLCAAILREALQRENPERYSRVACRSEEGTFVVPQAALDVPRQG